MGDFISPHMIYKYSKPQKNNQKCLKIIFFDSRGIGLGIMVLLSLTLVNTPYVI